MTQDYQLSISRRALLSALTGAAALPVASLGADVRRTVGIVGGGMAGVSLAWLLDGQRDVVLLEAQPALGGNVQTIPLNVGGQVYAVDVGAQYFHPNLYHYYVQLLTMLGLWPPALQQAHAFPASITVFAEGEANPRFVSPIVPERLWPVFAPWNWDGLGAFAIGFDAAKKREQQRADWGLTLGAWLPSLGLSRRQWEDMLLPWAASLFTGSVEQARGMSARAAMIFAAAAVPDNALDPVVNYVLNRGMAEPLRRMAAQMQHVEILTGAAVASIARNPQGGFLIVCADGRQRQVDDLVLASSGPSSLKLAQGIPGTSALQSVLGGIEFANTRIAIHSDPAYAPPDPNHWSFLNCQAHGEFCEASMWLAPVLTASPSPQTGLKLWKSWVTHRGQPPANTLHESNFRHMVPSIASLKAQAGLLDVQGRDGIWIAGGYTFPYDSQETALLSALNIAIGLSALSQRGQALFAK